MADTPNRRPVDRLMAEPSRRAVLAGLAGTATAAATLAPAAAHGHAHAPEKAGAKAATQAAMEADAKCADQPKERLAFLAASETLTGVTLGASYLELAGTVWGILAPTYGEAELRRLVALVNDPAARPLDAALRTAGLMPVAQAVAVTWYTGTDNSGSGPGVPFYNDALVWRSCTFTKPPATCGGEFGYWQYPA